MYQTVHPLFQPIRILYSLATLISVCILSANIAVTLQCSIAVWEHRHDVSDRSRWFFLLLCVSMLPLFVMRLMQLMLSPTEYPPMEVMSPVKVYSGLLYLSLLILYPIEVMRPRWLTLRRGLRLMAPLLVLGGIGLLWLPYTPLYSFDDFLRHIGEVNVWWRLLVMTATVVMFYVFLLRMPFNWRRSSADRRWVRRYALLMTPIGICFYIITFAFWMPVHVVHILYLAFFIGYYTYYELFQRIQPNVENREDLEVVDEKPEAGDDSQEQDISPTSHQSPLSVQLFRSLDARIERERLYCNPDFGRDHLCRLTGLSRAQMGQLLQQYTDAPNSQVYINRKRIAYAASLLVEHPEYSIEAISFECGLRIRTTFYRLFKNAYGMTPIEYRGKMLKKPSETQDVTV